MPPVLLAVDNIKGRGISDHFEGSKTFITAGNQMDKRSDDESERAGGHIYRFQRAAQPMNFGVYRIHITGYVDDLRPYLAHATAAICPVQYAVGIQNKVLEAMAMGTPTISTRVGCAALDIEPGQEIAVANTATEMAESVETVIRDKEFARRLSTSGRQYVEKHHDWDRIARALTATYTDLVAAQ